MMNFRWPSGFLTGLLPHWDFIGLFGDHLIVSFVFGPALLGFGVAGQLYSGSSLLVYQPSMT